MGTQKNRLNETVHLSTQNISLNWWVVKYLQFYTQIFCLSKPVLLRSKLPWLKFLTFRWAGFKKKTFFPNHSNPALGVAIYKIGPIIYSRPSFHTTVVANGNLLHFSLVKYIIDNYFSYFSTIMYVVGTQTNGLIERVLWAPKTDVRIDQKKIITILHSFFSKTFVVILKSTSHSAILFWALKTHV